VRGRRYCVTGPSLEHIVTLLSVGETLQNAPILFLYDIDTSNFRRNQYAAYSWCCLAQISGFYTQGSYASWKVLFFLKISGPGKSWKITGPGKSWKNILESHAFF